MSARHYRLSLALVAGVSLLPAGCGSDSRTSKAVDPITGAAPPPVAQASDDDTDVTIFTVLGMAKRESQRNIGPQTGNQVSPVLWQATQDTLNFAGIVSEDPMTGLLVTDWYSPARNRAQRLRVSVFILSRALRSDSLAVNVDRQERSADGQWRDTPIDKDTVTGIENAILLRARQIHAERYRGTM
jgi:hypothetical protein